MNHAPPRVESDLHAFIHWFLENQIDRFDLAVQRRDNCGRPLQFLGPKHTGHQHLDATQLQRIIPWLRAENAHGSDIYFRTHRNQCWPVVFLDDVPTDFARRIAHKYTAIVLETSIGRTHIWIATKSPLSCHQRGLAQRFLVANLQGMADIGSVSGDHWGRFPGTRNRKPGRDIWVNLHMLSQRQPWAQRFQMHLSSNRNRQHDKPCHDHSREEWGWVMGALENGMPSALVVERLIARAFPRRGRDASRYALHTVRRACQKLRLKPP